MTTSSAFIEPIDVLAFRGNRLYGEPGSFGEVIMPPPPSVAAGALRSHLLARKGVDLSDFAAGKASHPVVGSRDKPGSFVLSAFHLARRHADGGVEPLFPLPADVVVSGAKAACRVRYMRPEHKPGRALEPLDGGYPLPYWPVLAEGQERAKPESGWWLTAAGFRAWMKGEEITGDHLVESPLLWSTEARVGIGLDAKLRRAEEGKLFSWQAIAFRAGVGFAVCIEGLDDDTTLAGMLRFGGDGRGARLEPCEIRWPEPDWEAITAAKRARLLLTSPGIFERGWLPTGAGEPSPAKGAPFELGGLRGRIVCAAVPRAQFVSGWDLARWRPKPAQRAAPAGSVWWLELNESVSPDALRKLAKRGLWTDEDYDSDLRRAEGFNRLTFAVWRETGDVNHV